MIKVTNTLFSHTINIIPPGSCTIHPGNTQYNQHAQVTSLSDTILCGSTSYIVNVYNIVYDSDGNICGYNATINGEYCSW
jgi:hypothetical protein